MTANGASTTTPAERAEAFAAEVRAHLSDLPADEVDELLDGLGADLAERLREGEAQGEGGELDDPAEYAAELRQAAGLPPRDASAEAKTRRRLREASADWRANSAAWFDATPARKAFRDFAISLRPVWWVLRALALVWFFVGLAHYSVTGRNALTTLVIVVLSIIVSVQWGRGRWLPRNWLRSVRTVASVLAVALVIPFTGWLYSAATAGPGHSSGTVEYQPEPGLWANGRQIENIFAYDCEGNLIDLVRLYDQNGEPVDTTMGVDGVPPDFWDEEEQRAYVYRFNLLAQDVEAWNVFPLSKMRLSDGAAQPLGSTSATSPDKAELVPLARDCPVPADETDEAAPEADSDATGESTSTAASATGAEQREPEAP